MSRWIEVNELNITVETIASMDECKHLCNEVCCNDRCDYVADFVNEEDCKRCPHFTKEDGIISAGQ